MKTGKNRPPKSVRSGGQEAGDGGVAPLRAVPEGQGEVPWHEISDLRLTDSLVARVNYPNGNLMLAATDFDIAGVGQNLQLTRTYNSFGPPYGQLPYRWWAGYERRLDEFTNTMIVYDDTAGTIRFDKNDDGTFTTPDGYSLDFRKNGDGTYTLTDALGSVMGLVDAGGERTHTYDYGPTGLPRSTPTEAVPQPFGFAGTYLDPTGLYKMGARYYAPTWAASPGPTPRARRPTPTSTPAAAPSTAPIPPGCSAGQMWEVQ